MNDQTAMQRVPARSDGLAGLLSEPYCILLVLAAPGAISPSLVSAIQREFPWVLVEQRSDVAAVRTGFTYPVSLMLVDAPLLKAAEAAAAELSEPHPHMMTALILRSDQEAERVAGELSQSRLIRSVLPMNLRLDIWLSVIRLMLCGGEYYPASMLRTGPGKAPADAVPGNGSMSASDRAEIAHLVGSLTARETQILEMVARGHQNKAIAASFSLSEHTVKIHLHNIIGKLGVHNRTQAAALFRDYPVASHRPRSAI